MNTNELVKYLEIKIILFNIGFIYLQAKDLNFNFLL